MKTSQIAAQLFTLRDYLQTSGAVDRAFAKLRTIGFEAVQVSGTPVEPKEIKKYADANGLIICATHDSPDMIFKTPEALIDKLNLYECRHTAFPNPFEPWVIDRAAALEYAANLEKAAITLEAAGKTLSYHNHSIEFLKYDGELLFDIIYNNAPHLKAEIDTYWVQMGGGDPVEMVTKMAGRQVIFHLKDFGMLFPRSSVMAPVGSGNLNWKRIIPAAENAGVEWFIIEQDICQKNPFECLADSFNYLKENFC